VRLGTCIALELAACASAIGGVWVGVGHTVEVAGAYLSTHEAAAATYAHASTLPVRMPSGRIETGPPPSEPVPVTVTVFGVNDDALLEPIGDAPLTRVKINHGGTSLSLRLEFANGARAAFKPEQIHPQSDPRREIAAYRMDRLLGIGHVAPAKPMKLAVAELEAAADPATRAYVIGRIRDESRPRQGVLRGMAAWWIPEIRDAKLGGHDLYEAEGMSLLMSYLQIGAQIPPPVHHLVEQFATCIVFDVIIDNADRWTGSNTKVSPDQKTLYFMDNTLSFSKFRHGHDGNLKPFMRMQVFPRALVERLRALTIDDLRSALDISSDDSGLGRLLDDDEVRSILQRRNHLMERVDELIEKFGEDAVLALP